MATAAIFSHSMNAAQSLNGANAGSPVSQAAASPDTSGTSPSDTSSATISANDFLTLLVTEMKNQDPTANTDPNEYINQLVNVNSLEQLIDINQNLSTALGSPSPSTSGGAGTPTTADPTGVFKPDPTFPAAQAVHQTGSQPIAPSAASVLGTPGSALGALSSAGHTSGNLSVPGASAASHRVGHSLDGRPHSQSIAASLSAAQSSL